MKVKKKQVHIIVHPFKPKPTEVFSEGERYYRNPITTILIKLPTINCEHKNTYTNPTTNTLRCPDCNSILRDDGIWVKARYHIGSKIENDARLERIEECFKES